MKHTLDILTAPTQLPDPIGEDAVVPYRGRKVYIENYGCQMNLSDAEVIRSILTRDGYGFTSAVDDADVILLNTCSVREHAEERVYGRLAELSSRKAGRPELVLGVCGCMAQRVADRMLDRAPYVDFVMGPDTYRNLPEALGATGGDPFLDVRLDRSEDYADILPIREEVVKAWLTIQRGCDKFCTFCIVPFVRGRERSISLASLVEEARGLGARGVREVTLLGQTVNSYDDGEHEFADLLNAVAEVDGIERVRFTSPHPSDATGAMIRAMGGNPKVCAHMHLPMQSGSDDVLRRMRRTYTVEEYLRVVDDLRTHVPGVAITTDIIAGFCGETADDHAATCDVMRRVRFDSAFMFRYSPREGAVAHKKHPDDVPEDEKIRRLREIIDLQEAVSREVYAGHVGSVVSALVEGPSKRDPSDLYGKTDDFKTCVFPGRDAQPGDIVRVRVESATAHTLIGRIVS
ncbi:tRNA (N6-isopentenyl adenosine(37)-C2)-methylthiotransferase MiaB [Candidatus Poribacteria bacterium]|nr:tRNA (N6-isopentenyl adenosine(37)-C2)-methylthiotransferase MiaB [Candidatus Poribacteria bacterium]